MKLVPFKASSEGSLGVELELQIINPHTFGLFPRAKDLMRLVEESHNPIQKKIKPEITQSMIEINSTITNTPKLLLDDLLATQAFLLSEAHKLDAYVSGGGTHPFQRWAMQKIFPSLRYKKLSHAFRYLSKRATVFGQHIHIGCKDSADAIYLTHTLARYVPHLIAISASSPFYQGVDTGFNSSRTTVFNAFPLSGVMPLLFSWEDFSNYFYKMRRSGIISTMKDFYWDIRPKPEFGTVEIRVCDTPLTINKAVMIAAYLQVLARYLLQEKPYDLTPSWYDFYNYNRFQASRYGFEGSLTDPASEIAVSISEDILATIKKIERHANYLNNMGYLSQLIEEVINNKNDATLLRQIYKHTGSLPKLVNEQCTMWMNNKV